ncbi:hypothetical protein [Acaryochloris sp. IP29b_bin.137]|uniref:hypothetical protein n=1 Tax=Acaryochloris sp. IP29b_bin.137 TaxID=2969217 RepID=UPI00260AAD9E|nr:hypothetical protein [Acaryochloris sp. IP29b_bin.137]
MTDTSPDLPLGCSIRPLKMTDLDLLSLSIMPTNPYRLPSWLSVRVALFLAKIGQGIILASLPSTFLYLSILFMGGMGVSVQWVWILMVWLILLGMCIYSIFINHRNWLKFYWIVELQGRFIAYAF